jgi:polyhydroxybutyrate depolymerase
MTDRKVFFFSLPVAFTTLTSSQALANCLDQKVACKVAGGSYHLMWPPGVDRSKTVPAVVALHSWGASGFGLIRSGRMVKTMLARGYAVIAPEGLKRTDGEGGTWDFQPTQKARRDEVSFIKAVADDAATRANIDRNNMMLTGFSIGGSMTSYVACKSPGSFKAFAPTLASFWRPQPDSCMGPVKLLHSHGLKDTSVPLEGRTVGDGLRQGSVYEAMDIFRRANGCANAEPTSTGTEGNVKWRRWTGCSKGGSVELAFYPGGHSVPRGWADRALNWFERQ